jgi:membrane-associated phospholipid phosphatase
MPSFRALFQDFPRDLAGLFHPETAIILGVGGGIGAGLHPNDVRFTREAAGTGTMEEVLDPGQFLGDGFAQAGGAFATFLVGRLSHSARVANVGAELVRAQLVTAVLTESLKVTVRRRRPDGNTLSFPSGHTSASFASATVLQREFGWKMGVPAYAFASYVALSRLTENKHYASDLAFGAALGIVGGRSIKFHSGRHDLALSPMAVPGGGGMSVAWKPRQ